MRYTKLIAPTVGLFSLFAVAGEASAIPVPDSTTCNTSSPCLFIQQQNSINDGIYISSQGGPAVRGVSSGTHGVYGDSRSAGKAGVYGEGRTTAFAYGVYGAAVFGNGVGVFGRSDKGDGVEGKSVTAGKSGVFGHNDSGSGFGVFGAASGTGQAVHGENANSNGWAGYFNGKVFASTYQSSDARLKTDVKNIRYGLADVLKLRAVSFKWKSDSANPEEQLGLIAQEVQKTMPEIVHADGATGMLSVNYTALVPVLIDAVQEQQQVFKKQEARIVALERGPVTSSVLSGDTGIAALGLLALGLFVAARKRRAAV
ncbi:MAG TPA: tail fiber domain-containing protein [Polyangiales bacterium]|nr:tail fiber domain-containing protein [Polyangiales bacterium]